MAKERRPKPVRKKAKEYSLEVFDGDSPQDIVDRLMKHYGLQEMPAGAYFSVETDSGDGRYCYCEGHCYCSCTCRAEVELRWTQDETDQEYESRLKEWERYQGHLDRIKQRYAAKKAVKKDN